MEAPYLYCKSRRSSKFLNGVVYFKITQVRKGKSETGVHFICVREMVPDIILTANSSGLPIGTIPRLNKIKAFLHHARLYLLSQWQNKGLPPRWSQSNLTNGHGVGMSLLRLRGTHIWTRNWSSRPTNCPYMEPSPFSNPEHHIFCWQQARTTLQRLDSVFHQFSGATLLPCSRSAHRIQG